MMQTLLYSHGQHHWYIHKLHSPATNRVSGFLERCSTRIHADPAQLPVSVESDRARIAFLYKQSILLGNETV